MNCSCAAGSTCIGPALLNDAALCGFPAPVGTFSCTRDSGGTLPQDCVDSARFQCESCDVGEFSSVSFATQCSDCDPGYFSDTLGATTCEGCAAGFYSATSRSSACSGCLPGTEQPLPHQTACSNCTAGYFSANADVSFWFVDYSALKLDLNFLSPPHRRYRVASHVMQDTTTPSTDQQNVPNVPQASFKCWVLPHTATLATLANIKTTQRHRHVRRAKPVNLLRAQAPRCVTRLTCLSCNTAVGV